MNISATVSAGMIIVCWLIKADVLTFANVVYTNHDKEVLWIEFLDEASNRKLTKIARSQVIRVIANDRKSQ